MKKFLLLVVVAVFFVGCATMPQLTRDEWLKLTYREYKNVSSEQVFDAVHKVLYLADGDDFRFSYGKNYIYANRGFGLLM